MAARCRTIILRSVLSIARFGAQPAGVAAIARIFEALGYRQKDKYIFEDKKLTAWHWEHANNPANPKIFISQLEVDQLPADSAENIKKIVAAAPDLVSLDDQKLLAPLADGKSFMPGAADDLATRLAAFFARPWAPPPRQAVDAIDKDSQYAAWTFCMAIRSITLPLISTSKRSRTGRISRRRSRLCARRMCR